jgi:N-formylglutamate amidohydrolase
MADALPAQEETDLEPAFEVLRPAPGATLSPLVFASPHSGRHYPADMAPAPGLDRAALRRSEDAFVDDLLAPAPGYGCTVICARYARAYIDVNREAWELDQAMFNEALPVHARRRTARVAAGLGSIARVVAEGQEIYDRKLSFGEAARRVETVHAPYHAALGALLAEVRAAHGYAILVDWHSMPSAAVEADARLARAPEAVLGDRFGASCAPLLMRTMEAELGALGLETARNTPYAGGYTTEAYGRPREALHAIQVELNRSLYLDERTMTRSGGYARLAEALEKLFARLAATDWSQLRPRG